jgi:hypothetical protein
MALRTGACRADAETAGFWSQCAGWVRVMAYGHAERALDAIRLLEAETAALLHRLPELDAEQAGWLQEVSRQREGEVKVTIR